MFLGLSWGFPAIGSVNLLSPNDMVRGLPFRGQLSVVSDYHQVLELYHKTITLGGQVLSWI
jgi:hypothetical protein